MTDLLRVTLRFDQCRGLVASVESRLVSRGEAAQIMRDLTARVAAKRDPLERGFTLTVEPSSE